MMKKPHGSKTWLDKLKQIVALRKLPPAADAIGSPALIVECCQRQVNIAYRGVSDDRLYCVYGRRSEDIKFFKPRGLRVFCSDCRKRLL